MRRPLLASLALLMAIGILAESSPVQAEDASLPYSPAVEVPVLVLGTAGLLVSETVFKKDLAPATCHWCVPNAVDSAVRQALVWRQAGTADTLSNLGAYALAPAVAVGGLVWAAYRVDRPMQIPVDLLVVAESSVLALDLDQAVKFSVGRERPFVHALPASQKSLTAAPDDNNVSFFSGHTSWTFALATSAATVAWLHGYRLAPCILGVGLILAASTAYLRIAADKHYLTDVLTGAALGSAIGVGLPYLLHRPTRAQGDGIGGVLNRASVAVGPISGGVAATAGLRF